MPEIYFTVQRPEDFPVEVWPDAMEELYRYLIDLTPVDTGFCAEQWDYGVTEDEATFLNDAEYASYLEDGWSKQAPNGMIGPALAELPNILEEYYTNQ